MKANIKSIETVVGRGGGLKIEWRLKKKIQLNVKMLETQTFFCRADLFMTDCDSYPNQFELTLKFWKFKMLVWLNKNKKI